MDISKAFSVCDKCHKKNTRIFDCSEEYRALCRDCSITIHGLDAMVWILHREKGGTQENFHPTEDDKKLAEKALVDWKRQRLVDHFYRAFETIDPMLYTISREELMPYFEKTFATTASYSLYTLSLILNSLAFNARSRKEDKE